MPPLGVAMAAASAAESKKFPAIEQPKQASAIDAGERFGTVAAEQIERPPTEPRRTGGPAVVEEPSAVVDEVQPPLGGMSPGGLARIEPRQRLGPSPRRAAIELDDACTLVEEDLPVLG